MSNRTGFFDPYVPRVASEWDQTAPGELWQSIDGALAIVDLSGFTTPSEKLASRGRPGAEELISLLGSAFGNMLDVAYERGGSLLKFGGDEGQSVEKRLIGPTIEAGWDSRDPERTPVDAGIHDPSRVTLSR